MGCFFLYIKNKKGEEKLQNNIKKKIGGIVKDGNIEKTRQTDYCCGSCNGNDGFIGYRLSAGKNC